MSILIKEAQKKDSHTICNFILALGRESEFSDMYVGTVSGIEEQFFGDNKTGYAFLAFDADKKPVGMVVFSYVFYGATTSKIAYMHYLYVIDAMRNKGIGTQLMAHLKNFVAENNLGQVRLLCEHSNTKAREFYQKFGSQEWPQVLTIDLPV